MRPTEPSSPISTPSYKRCAIIIVRFTLKRSLRDESCCSLLVVNGGAALRRRSFFSTERTIQSAFSSAARIFSASSPLLTSTFSSPLPRNRASNAGGLLAARLASIVQYSTFLERLDFAFALDDQAEGNGLHAAGGKAASDFVPQRAAKPDIPRGGRAHAGPAARPRDSDRWRADVRTRPARRAW